MRIIPALTIIVACFMVPPLWGQPAKLDSIVNAIASAPTKELSALSFFELNILKNVIFSSKGYRYADDRTWLEEYFYYPEENRKLTAKALAFSTGKWNFEKLTFPKPVDSNSFKMTPVMEKAVANVRVALYKKIEKFRNLTDADSALEKELRNFAIIDEYHEPGDPEISKRMQIFGRITRAAGRFKESLKREIHGYQCVLNIIAEKRDFDACELLGIYIGSVSLLKNVIEAQNGKLFDGTTAWEISQLTTVTPPSKPYSVDSLPDTVKMKLNVLDFVIKKVNNSAIGDLPKQFQKNEKFSYIEFLEGC